jgi:hypothetical protein
MRKLGALVVMLGAVEALAMDENPQCTNLEVGDKSTCLARAEKECTDPGVYQRKVCQAKIVNELEQCGTVEFVHDASIGKRIADIARSPTFTDAEHQAEVWVAHARSIEADAKTYASLFETWKSCTRKFRDLPYDFTERDLKMVQEAPAAFRQSVQQHFDEVLGIIAREAKPHTRISHYALELALAASTLNAKLPATWRSKEDELKKVIASDAADAKKVAAKEQARVAQVRCPPGAPLTEPYLSVARSDEAGTGISHRVYRFGEERFQERRGLVTVEKVPVVECYEQTLDGARSCAYQQLSVYREKLGNGAWTSWMLAVGGGGDFNCAKF